MENKPGEDHSDSDPEIKPKAKSAAKRPRREKPRQKATDVQEKRLEALPEDIREESPPAKVAVVELPADAGAGHAQVQVTLSMQVERAPNPDDDEGITPEKENALSSAASGVEGSGKSKTNRKITSYFTVVGQQAEI